MTNRTEVNNDATYIRITLICRLISVLGMLGLLIFTNGCELVLIPVGIINNHRTAIQQKNATLLEAARTGDTVTVKCQRAVKTGQERANENQPL